MDRDPDRRWGIEGYHRLRGLRSTHALALTSLALLATTRGTAAQELSTFAVQEGLTYSREAELRTLSSPRRARPRTVAAGRPIWTTVIAHSDAVSWLRVHVVLRRGWTVPPGFRLVFRTSIGSEVDALTAESPFVALGEYWSVRIPGSVAVVELFAATIPEDAVQVDRYSYARTQLQPQGPVGPDDRIPIQSAAADIQARGTPVVHLVSSGRGIPCTAFLVTTELLVTNRHCVPTAEEAVGALATFGFDSVVTRGTPRQVLGIEAFSDDLDYALLRLAAPAIRHPIVRWPIGSSVAVRTGLELQIIQHGEVPKLRVAPLRVKTVGATACSVAQLEVANRRDLKVDFSHGCDTSGGSSGSPVLLSGSGILVGLHHLGYSALSASRVNQAVPIAALEADLRAKWPAVWRQIETTNQEQR